MADYQYLNDTGVIVPDTSDILTEVQNEYRAALGSDLNVAASTPQGVLITAESLARAEVVENNAAVANQINPNIAGGVFLEAICAMTGLAVPAGTPSVVPGVLLAGVGSTVIASGSQARTTAGDIFESITTVTLDPITGQATVDFQSVEVGTIPCDADELTTIVTDVLGWETVNNPNAATLGVGALSNEALRALRKNTLALQGVSLVEATVSALYDVSGVKSLSFRENIANTTQVIDGITMVAHSIWACVDGGTDIDVATALLGVKTMGANWNGDVEIAVTEPSSGQDYIVKFDRPDEIPIWVRVSVRSGTISGNVDAQVTAAVLAYTAGQVSNMPGYVIGSDVSPFEIAGAVVAQIPGVFVAKVEISLDGISYQTTEIGVAIDEIATQTEAHITVAVV